MSRSLVPSPVHPRVGGEHHNRPTSRRFSHGSSPRGRGTHQRTQIGPENIRFIPAWAGNTRCRMVRCSSPPVHPRVGGEHLLRHDLTAFPIGSSPRGRGTHHRARDAVLVDRFIPAWAGNTMSCFRAEKASSVHPRVGGEHNNYLVFGDFLTGSSPRGRGTQVSSTLALDRRRFIPAWAGNTLSRPARIRVRTVHPRVGGEHQSRDRKHQRQCGSSPRGRGTRHARN